MDSSGNYASVITVNPNVHAEETDVCIFEQTVEDVATRMTITTDYTVGDINVDTESPRVKTPSVFSGEAGNAGYINLPNILQPVDGADGKGEVTYTIETPTAGWNLNTPALTSAKGENVLEYYFVNPGTYTVTVDVTDKVGNPPTPVVITVNVAAPYVPPVVTPPSCPPGTSYFDGGCG